MARLHHDLIGIGSLAATGGAVVAQAQQAPPVVRDSTTLLAIVGCITLGFQFGMSLLAYLREQQRDRREERDTARRQQKPEPPPAPPAPPPKA